MADIFVNRYTSHIYRNPNSKDHQRKKMTMTYGHCNGIMKKCKDAKQLKLLMVKL